MAKQKKKIVEQAVALYSTSLCHTLQPFSLHGTNKLCKAARRFADERSR
jgi:hypothetical protein